MAWEGPSAALWKAGSTGYKWKQSPVRKALHNPAEGGWCPGLGWRDVMISGQIPDLFWNWRYRKC